MRRWTHLSLLVLLAMGGTVLAVRAQPASPNSAKDKSKASAQTQKDVARSDPSLYVGSETCKTCHADMPSKDFFNHFEVSPHFVTTLDSRKGPQWQGCEGCHGPGKAHVDGGGDKTKIFTFKNASAQEINARCMSCHAGGPQHMDAVNSIHTKSNVSCMSCHSPHNPETKEFLLTKAQPALCYSCHLQQKAQFEMPFRHRVNEGLVQCSDCHNPHGTVGPKQVRTSPAQDAVCITCHTDKQGPFVFEHEPVKIEGCASCHIPHGGANVHMLRVSNVNLLCLQCHTNSLMNAKAGSAPGTPSFHSQQTFFKSCTLCHVQIHGSNFDPTFFK